jgi:crotonobetainyl-CoA:carnitine CoA-transferase CaiB-like acyl-CoA transferase
MVEFDQPTVGKVRQPRPAARFDVTEARTPSAAPLIGQHTREVLSGLGYSGADIEALAAQGVIRLGGETDSTKRAAS